MEEYVGKNTCKYTWYLVILFCFCFRFFVFSCFLSVFFLTFFFLLFLYQVAFFLGVRGMPWVCSWYYLVAGDTGWCTIPQLVGIVPLRAGIALHETLFVA